MENKNTLQVRFEYNQKDWRRRAILQKHAPNGDLIDKSIISIKVANLLIADGMTHSS